MNLKLRQSYGVGASCDYPLPTETTLSLSWEPLQSKQAEVYQRERIPKGNFIFSYLVKELQKLRASRVDYQKECWCWCLRSHYCGASVINSLCHRWTARQSIWHSLYGFFVFNVWFQSHHHWVFTLGHSCSFLKYIYIHI